LAVAAAADYFPRKWMSAAGEPVLRAPLGHLVLREVEYLRFYDSRMAVFNEILRNFALV
jgi:hypothetical protein